MVGSGGNILSLDVSGGQMQTFSPISSPTANDLHCIHVFRDNSFIVAGASGTIYYDNLALSGWINCSPSTNAHYTNFTFNDIYFRDDINGYVVGDSATNLGGVIMKCQVLGGAGQIQSLSPTTYSGASNPLGFVEEPVEDGSTAKNIVSNTNQVNYNTIAFTGPYDGFVGGSYSTTPPSNTQNYPYARLLNDRGGEFSRLIWYDRVGRLTVGQDSKQHNYARQAYSYTLYDQVGHVLEVGQKTDNIDTANGFNKIFGDTLFGLYNTSIISPTKFLAWIKDSTGPRTEVSHTYYSNQSILPLNVLTQSNLRNRIVSITYSDTLSSDSLKYSSATHYDYDIQGDVKEIIKDNPRIGIANQRYKSISYKYSMIGKTVDEVDYQNDSLDQYHHKFSYDQDNRLVCVQTSKDSILWDNDANYFYYPHGELARMEIGDQKIQGVDYAYTLQGWIKGKNSDLTTAVNDIGHDGLQQSGNLNRCFARDAMGFSLKYFDKSSQFPGDYDAISSAAWSNVANRFEAYTYGSDLTNGRRDLFNGNVSAVVTTITKPQVYSKSTPSLNPVILPQGAAYSYDQLNRLITMKAYQNINASTNTWGTGSTYVGLYYDSLRYDENGNILYQQRNDSVGGVMSMLNYHYNIQNGLTLQNRLYNVNNIATNPNPLDIKDEGIFNSIPTTINQKNNYRYTAMGELGKDTIGGIDTIIWKTNGKIWKVKKYNGDSIIFVYNSRNSRVLKEFRPASGTPVYTYYMRNLEGNIVSIYTERTVGSTIEYILDEREIYGNNKLGIDRTPIELISPTPSSVVDTFARYAGLKEYELGNYLDNVLAVVTDRKIPRPNSGGDSVEYYEPDVINAKDYYPFGMVEPGRHFRIGGYRFAFNGKEKDDELYGADNSYDYGMRMYDPRLSRFMTKDPLSTYTYAAFSPYSYCANNPILFVDRAGNRIYIDYLDENGNLKSYDYLSTDPVPDNDFVRNTIAALNYLKLDDCSDPKLVGRGDNIAFMLNGLAQISTKNVHISELHAVITGKVENRNLGDLTTPVYLDKNGGAIPEKAFEEGAVKNNEIGGINNTTIEWDPYQGLELMKDGSNQPQWALSPAVCLGHELLGHSFSALLHTTWYLANDYDDGTDLSTPEEAFTITVVEHNMASFFGDGIRWDHISGQFFYTEGVTSNQPSQSGNIGTPITLTPNLNDPFSAAGIIPPYIPSTTGSSGSGGSNGNGNSGTGSTGATDTGGASDPCGTPASPTTSDVDPGQGTPVNLN